MSKKITIGLITLFLFIVGVNSLISKNSLIDLKALIPLKIKELIPLKIKEYIKSNFLSKNEIIELNRMIEAQYKQMDQYEIQIKQLNKTINEKNLQIDIYKLKEKRDFQIFINEYSRNFIKNSEELIFTKSDDVIYQINNKNYKLSKFYFPWLDKSGNRFYIRKFENYLIIFTGFGDLIYANLDDFKKENNVHFKKIELKFPKKHVFDSDHPIFKDFLIFKNKIYISFLSKYEDNCIANTIVVGEMNFNNILLDDFFKTNDCNYKFSGQTGGKLGKFLDDKILFSVGDASYWEEWEENKRNLIPFDQKRSYDASQNLESHLGKVLSINVENKDIEILSMGHRNVQGIYYDNVNNQIFLSEHGPKGGDELNLIDLNNNNRNKNFGWPIVSHGEHYKYNETTYKYAPLKKPHGDFGFQEPLISFNKRVAPGNLTLANKFANNQKDKLVVYLGGMGKSYGENKLHQSLVKLVFDNKMNHLSTHAIPIKARIRDVLYLEDLNELVLALESISSIGFLSEEK